MIIDCQEARAARQAEDDLALIPPLEPAQEAKQGDLFAVAERKKEDF